jgi:hypothetical protein
MATVYKGKARFEIDLSGIMKKAMSETKRAGLQKVQAEVADARAKSQAERAKRNSLGNVIRSK